jgi:hypothetical protein
VAIGWTVAFVCFEEYFQLWAKWRPPKDPNDPRRIMEVTDREDQIASRSFNPNETLMRKQFQARKELRLAEITTKLFKVPKIPGPSSSQLEPGQYGDIVLTKSPEIIDAEKRESTEQKQQQ